MTVLPLVDYGKYLDDGRNLFARLTYADALAVADLEGARLIDPETLVALGDFGVQLYPYLGTPTAETDEANSRLHDADVWRQLDAMGWSGEPAVSGAGKHWVLGAPPGRSRLMGWDRDGAGPGKALWQPLSVAHNRHHHDDGTTTMLERPVCGRDHVDTDPPGPDATSSFPPPPSGPRPTIMRGSVGGHVMAWQRVIGTEADGNFGPKTEAATRRWQREHDLADDGIVGPNTWGASTDEPAPDPDPTPTSLEPVAPSSQDPELTVSIGGYELIPARNYTSANRSLSSITNIVLHSTENPVRDGVASNVAKWFSGPSSPRASAHFIVGPEETIQGVQLHDVAWAAPGANRTGVQVEQVGQALRTDWLAEGDGDRHGLRVLRRSALLVAQLCHLLRLPVARVGPRDLKRGARGITSHAAVTKAFRRSTHIDPGGINDTRWPWPEYLLMVDDELKKLL